mmetsp:Transcript_1166/g.2325  ORF Transcript_1166/g.2325 Transcript_1166/m.2325 type:complete len:114 (-) Transcript_1166:129-470(-)
MRRRRAREKGGRTHQVQAAPDAARVESSDAAEARPREVVDVRRAGDRCRTLTPDCNFVAWTKRGRSERSDDLVSVCGHARRCRSMFIDQHLASIWRVSDTIDDKEQDDDNNVG